MILGIMGGMGPAATVNFFGKLLEYSNASKDQEHIHLLIDSNVKIPDRSEYIAGKGENPVYEMVRTALRLEMMGADYIAMPCNTAHFFYEEISKYIRIPLINMVTETAKFLIRTEPAKKNYFLMATEGTYASGIYQNVFQKYQLNVMEPDRTDKSMIMKWIHSIKSGDCTVSPTEVEALIKKYTAKSERVILGCTELPLLAKITGVPEEFIDPSSILAHLCVEIAEKGGNQH